MDSEKLRLLVKTVEYGNLSQAAKSMGYTQSAASYSIQSLEEELGVILLHRSKHGMQLTSDGMLLMNIVRDCITNIDKLYTTAHFIQGVQVGVLRIASFSSVSVTCLPWIIRQFHTAFPNIKIEIISGKGTYGEMEEYLLSGRVDCSFITLPVSPKLHCVELRKDPLYLILPTSHPLAALTRPIRFSDLTNVPFIMPAKEKNNEIMYLCKKNNFEPNVIFTMYDDLSILGMVENNLGCTIAPELLVKYFHYRVAVKEIESNPYRTICLAVRNGEETSPLLNAFLTSVQSNFAFSNFLGRTTDHL